jgi:hypothetical protein
MEADHFADLVPPAVPSFEKDLVSLPVNTSTEEPIGVPPGCGLEAAAILTPSIAMRYIPAVACLLLAACSGPDESNIRSEFMRSRLTAELVSLAAGEGDGDNVYYHIRYRLAGDPTVHQEVWGYHRRSGLEWTHFSIDTTDLPSF